MNTNTRSSLAIRSWLAAIIISVAIIGLSALIAIPNFIGGGPSKLSSIINNLRQMDGAKQQWALEHGISNATKLTRELTDEDLTPYLTHRDNKNHFDRFGSGFDRNGHVHPVADEQYRLNSIGSSPEAVLSKKFKQAPIPLPKGSIIRLDETGAEEYILPDQPSKVYRWIGGVLTVTND